MPDSLRDAARFPLDASAERDAAVWADVLAVASRELASLTTGAAEWAEETRALAVGKLDEAARLAVAAKAPLLAAQERGGSWRGTGARRFEDYLATQSRAGKGQARREAQAARTLEELDGGHDALVDGTFTPPHVDRLGTVLGKLPEEKRELLTTGHGAQKVKQLAKQHDATEFGRRLEELATSLTPKAMEDAHQSARSRRHLELSPTSDGMTRITGLLDAVAGHTLRLALDAASPRPGEDDDRPPAQRAADALTSIASNSLREAKATGNARAQILITMTGDTFARARAHLAADSHLRDDADHDGGAGALGPAPAVRLQDGPVLPPSELARVLCDSEIARLVIGAESEPLDLGRSVRLFSPAQRRAVIARDQGCFWAGCTIPSRYCEVHHLDWWDEDGGHTDISRGVLVCTFHHGQLHSRKLDVVTSDELREHLGGQGPGGPRAASVASGSAVEPGGATLARPDPGGEPPPPARSGGEPPLPGDPSYSPPRYRTIPRSSTEKQRGDARRARLLDEIRDTADERRARLADRRASRNAS